MSIPITVHDRVAQLVRRHGSYRAAASKVGMTYAYLWRIGRGDLWPRPETLAKIGLDANSGLFQPLQRRDK